MKYILYLHGFHSSPNSEKALLFKQAINSNYDDIEVIAPQLSVFPSGAIEQIKHIMQIHQDQIIGIVGSSLGGYLATYLHNQFGTPIVVVNPATKPFELLHDYLGEQTQPITHERYELTETHMLQLKAIYQETLANPKQIWLLQQEGDEVLDYRQALTRYKDCHITCELGGSHGFDGFERFPLQITEFFLKHINTN